MSATPSSETDEPTDRPPGAEPPAEAEPSEVEASADPGDDPGAEAQGTEDEEEAESGPRAEDLPAEELDRIVEALLFASSEPLTAQKIGKALGGASPRLVKASIERLREEYQAHRRAFDVLEIADGFRLYSRPEFETWVARLEKVRAPERLSASALETLAVIAYRQPIVRAEIDAVRGVQCSAILRSLLDRKLIKVVGRSDQPGRPLQYGTTRRFLDHFGLASVQDLPRVEDLKAP